MLGIGMNAIKVLGVEGYSKSELLKENVLKALKNLKLDIDIEEIYEVDQLIRYGISGIPALVIQGEVISQKVIPGVEELEVLFKSLFLSQKKNFPLRSIIVPTDFSKTARNAFDYAIQLSAAYKAELKVVHVLFPEWTDSQFYAPSAFSGFLEEKTFTLNNFIRQDPAMGGHIATLPKIEKEVMVGFPSESIIQLSSAPGTDMIVMGTTGDGDILEKIFGSVSTNVAQKAHCPVLLVPDGAAFKPYRKILYASNNHPGDAEMMDNVISFAGSFGTDIHYVHINGNPTSDYEVDLFRFEQAFKTGAPGVNFSMVQIESKDLLTALNRYAEENDIDLIVMSTTQRPFLKELFHKSVTKRMVFSTRIPLMVMHYNK